ncbi:class IIb bacteriocin, lactobin A/cerein 7B family [Flavobacterium psychrophilum]
MLDLENLGLVEMNAQEVQEVEGGILPLIAFGLGCLYLYAECTKYDR